ncbi:PIN domain-containing protein [Haoranjiania flava]|uniref:PIN domain-containing protein n=1 Tax=Haoranjiania flava TaxID=1856322 RepID=A0AAE3INQ5_9BACT|nr:PIN domain-containing protein [Haoranjiania flava]MCU7693047.1 PIN domain-containing protein [Haoranjiania flava]
MAKKFVISDTDVLIDCCDTASKRHAVIKTTLEKTTGLDNVIISAITKMLLLAGATNKSDEAKTNKQLLRQNTAFFNNEITLKAIERFKVYRLSHGLSIPDCMIAATCAVTGVDYSHSI